MQYRIAFLLIIVLLMLIFPYTVMAEQAETINMIPLDPPLHMDDGWDFGETEGEFTSNLPEGYSIIDLWRQDLLYFALIRDDGVGGHEILLLMDVNHDDADNLSYISGSYERSGQMYLYIMMISGETSHGLLYRYDIVANHFDQILPEPCSTNMVLLSDNVQGYECSGIILYEDTLLTIDLRTAEIVETVSIADLGGLPEINNSFFAGDVEPNIRKYTYLDIEGSYHILMNSIVVDYSNFSDLHKYTFVYDVLTKQIIEKFQTDGEF